MNGVLRVPVRRRRQKQNTDTQQCREEMVGEEGTAVQGHSQDMKGEEEEGMEFAILTVQPCLNTKLCQAFPLASHEQRCLLRLDPEACFSVTDTATATAMTDACLSLLSVLPDVPRSAVDATAGGGGNTAALISSRSFEHVTAYEMHPERAADLSHNLHTLFPSGSEGLVGSWDVRGRSVTSLVEQPPLQPLDLVFFDPPW